MAEQQEHNPGSASAPNTATSVGVAADRPHLTSFTQLWNELMDELGVTGPVRESPAALLDLLPTFLTTEGWIAVSTMSLLNRIVERVMRESWRKAELKAREDRRRRRLGAWEERQHKGLEKLHEMLAELDIPDVDLNTVDMHEWLDYTFWRLG